MSSRICHTPLALAWLLVFGVLMAAASTAVATPHRDFESQITGPPGGAPRPGPFVAPNAVLIDGADNLWVADSGAQGYISKFDSSGNYLSQVNGESVFSNNGGFIEALARDESNGNLYATDVSETDIFDSSGAFLEQFAQDAPGGNRSFIAIDHSGGPTGGRIYVAEGSSVTAFNEAGSPVDFSATASYINGNELIGPFSQTGDIEVDGEGNIYVIGSEYQEVDEFAPSGTLVQRINNSNIPGGFGRLAGIAVDPVDGNILVSDETNKVVDEFDPGGVVLDQLQGTAPPAKPFEWLRGGIAVNSAGKLYVGEGTFGTEHAAVDVFGPNVLLPKASLKPVQLHTPNAATLGATVYPNGEDVTRCDFEYGLIPAYGHSEPCTPDPSSNSPTSNFKAPTDVTLDLNSLLAETTYHFRVVAGNPDGTSHSIGGEFTTPPAAQDVQTELAEEITNKSATLSGSFTGEEGLDARYYFEYGTSTNYGHIDPSPAGPVPTPLTGTETEQVNTEIEGLAPATVYHYRLVIENKFGVAPGPDRTFNTYQPPTIEGLSSSHVTATSAFLEAQINPQGLPAGTETECRFEYGQTTSYGSTAACPEELSGSIGRHVTVEIEGLQPGVVFHFRLVAHNRWGTVTTEDQTFEFFPPSCPNSAVRQQTGSAFLPDCRAYELVSPGNANGTLLYPGGPNTGLATSPSRFSFTGNFSALPGANPINTGGDLYVATRGNAGWTSRYIGLPGDQAGCMGGPPTAETSHSVAVNPPFLTNSVLSDPSMSHFIDFLDGVPVDCLAGTNGLSDVINKPFASPSNAPYLWNADGVLERRLPSNVDSPGALDALECPYLTQGLTVGLCSGETTTSPDLGHLIFSSNLHSFSESPQDAGLITPPGSAYDNNLSTNEIKVISLLPNGEDIPQDSTYATMPPVRSGEEITVPGGPQEFIRFPAISADGSHILMSTSTAATPFCPRAMGQTNVCPIYSQKPLHLYMRIDDAITFEIAEGKAVTYVAMTPDGSKLYFTSPERLTGEDHDNSTDLYLWSAERAEHAEEPLVLVSKGDNAGLAGEAGNTDNCAPALTHSEDLQGNVVEEEPWTSACGVLPYSGDAWSWTTAGVGGNGISDTALATDSGDIYFYSPEQLDGDLGLLGQQNLYLYRGGRVQFVAALKPEHHCAVTGFGETLCSDGPVTRIDVTPSGSRIAFVTASRLTPYDSAGHLEMYAYTPATEALVCDSCRPDGQPATGNVNASQDGRFMTDDGRVFFSTAEPLVSQDTNEGPDVYEFGDGRPQLITPGTGVSSFAADVGGGQSHPAQRPGLVGVSADGTDVYFSTLDNLTAEDHNGNFLKFYDARTNGGFPQPPPIQPCAAAEECHGPGTEAPTLPTQGTEAALSGGNVKAKPRKRHKGKHRRKTGRKDHRHAGRKAAAAHRGAK